MQVSLSGQSLSSLFRQESRFMRDSDENKSNNGRLATALLDKLANNIPGMSASKLKALDPEDFTPEKVASRISSFVAQGLEQARARGASDADLDRMYQAALSGVNQGFEEAGEWLQEQNLLTPEIEENVAQTKSLTFEALDALDPAVAPTSSRQQTFVSAAERYAKAESFSLEIMTQEGDKISIQFDSQASQTMAFADYSDGNTRATVLGFERSERSNFSFSVKGDLNEKELDALNTLMQDIDAIAEDFYGGDIQDAFAQATELQMDASQLKNLNLSMTQSTSYTAVAAYEQVQRMGNPLGEGGGKLGQLMNNFNRAVNDPGLDFLQDRAQLGANLLDNLARQDIRYQEADDDAQEQLDGNLSLLRDMLAQLDQDED